MSLGVEVIGGLWEKLHFWALRPHLVVVVGMVNASGDGLWELQDRISVQVERMACGHDANATLYPPGWCLPWVYGLLVVYLRRFTPMRTAVHRQLTLMTKM